MKDSAADIGKPGAYEKIRGVYRNFRLAGMRKDGNFLCPASFVLSHCSREL
jgi:hypothetical protein